MFANQHFFSYIPTRFFNSMADDSSKIEVVAQFDMDNLSKPLYMHEMRSIRDVFETDELYAGYRRTKLLPRADAPKTKDVYRIYVFCILVIYVHILYIYLPVFMLFICLFDSIERIFTVQFTVYVIWWYWLVIWLSWSVVVQIMCKIPAWVQVLFCLWHESGCSNCSAFAIMILAWFLCLFDSIKDIYCTV